MRIRSIPPVTSTGGNRGKTKVHLDGLAHMSMGRYMSEMAKKRDSEEADTSWDITKFSKSDFNRKSEKKNKIVCR